LSSLRISFTATALSRLRCTSRSRTSPSSSLGWRCSGGDHGGRPSRYFCGRRHPLGARLRRGQGHAVAFAAMGGGRRFGRGAKGGRPRPSCSMATVNPVNSHHVIAQARQEAALTKMVTHDETPGGMAYQAAWPMSLLHRRGVPTFPRREVPGRGTFKGQPLHIRRCFGGPEELNCNWPR
jgi:hypothetical protein